MMIDNKDQSWETRFSDLSKIAKGAGITLGGMIGGKGLLFFYTIFLARCLSASQLGLYFLGITIVGLLSVLSNLGLNVGVTRFVAIYNGQNDPYRMKGVVLVSAFITLLPSLTIVAIIFLLADLVASYIFHKPELGDVIKLLSLSIPFDSLMWVFLAATRGLKFMQYTVYTENLAWVGLRFLFALIFLYGLGMGLEGVVLAHAASSFFSAGLAFHYANRLIRLADRKVTPIFEVKSLLKFSIPMVFSAFLHNLNRQIDILMLGLFVSSAHVGIYGVAVRLIVLAEVVFGIFQPIFHPFISDLHAKKQMVKLANLLKILTKWSVTMSFPLFLSLLCFPVFFLQFFGKEFGQAATCLVILAIGHMFSSFSGLTSALIYMSGRSDITFKNNLTVITANAIINYLLIPRYGMVGAAFATGISLVLIGIIRISEAYYLMKIHPFIINLWKPISAGLISLIMILFLRSTILDVDKHITLVLLSLFPLFYLSLLFFFKLGEEDLYIKALIQRRVLSFIKRNIFIKWCDALMKESIYRER